MAHAEFKGGGHEATLCAACFANTYDYTRVVAAPSL